MKVNTMNLSMKHNIIIPSTNGLNSKANEKDILKVKMHVADVLARECGGCTLSEKEGYYVAEDGQLVIEYTTEIYTIGKADNLQSDQVMLKGLAEYVKRELNQECVLTYSHPCEMELV